MGRTRSAHTSGKAKKKVGERRETTKKTGDFTDYRRYHLSGLEVARYLLEGCVLAELVGLVFFRGIPAKVLVLLGAPIYLAWKKRRLIRKRKEEFAKELMEALQSLSVALQVGYSMENAWKEVYVEMKDRYGASAGLCKDLEHLLARLEVNEPVERVLSNLAVCSDNEDLILFADIVSFAKRSGGNMNEIIRTTVGQMNEKAEVDRDIRTLTAGKRMEQRVMCLVPLGIIIYLRGLSPGYLDVFYDTPQGVLAMIVCLLAYLGAYGLGVRIVDIRV